MILKKTTKKSNGGFAVTKGDYVYFINGVQSNTADNAYGEPEKGAIYRISTENFAKHSYAEVDCVVPHVAFNFDYDTGLFIYGNYIYFATPSVNRDDFAGIFSKASVNSIPESCTDLVQPAANIAPNVQAIATAPLLHFHPIRQARLRL